MRPLPSKFRTLKTFLLAACATASVACSSSGEEPLGGFSDWKDDTGYVGNRAAELEATFTGTVRVELPGQTAAELQAIADELLADPNSYRHREIGAQVTEQMKYARNALKAQKFDLNLEGGRAKYPSVTVEGDGLNIEYAVTVESLVKFKELEDQGLTPRDLIGKVIEPKLPLVPAGLYERVGAKCATDGDSGAQPDEQDLNENNLFYYFDSSRTECPMTVDDLVVARYEVTSSLDAKTVYPEYDRLIEDGEISMVVIFGQIKHGDLSPWDWGFRSFGDMTDRFEDMGFQRTESYSDSSGEKTGHKLSQTYPGGLKVVIDMYNPIGFADDVPTAESSERFRDAIRSNEIVYYNGHAFYGSLDVLDEPSVYPVDGYQIINMDACWSYAYYTKQVFRNKATDEDPEGFALADVVNNTEPGITGSEATGAVLYENIFIGADRVHAGLDASDYSWNNMIGYMNAHAEERAARRTTYPDPEIYGVSGVTTNTWQPQSQGDETSYKSAPGSAIPDNDVGGVYDTLDITRGATIAGLRVEVDVSHTYRGDLTVELVRGSERVVLIANDGGGQDDLVETFGVSDFNGQDAAGDWTLHVYDSADIDTGSLNSWTLTIIE